MIYTIDEELCKKNDISLNALLLLLLIKNGADINTLLKDLEISEAIIKENDTFLITSRWDDLISNILLSKDKSVPAEDTLLNLTNSLMQIFPKGKKQGTCHYFRGNRKDILLRLKKFFKLYGKYTDKQILEASKKYVESFNEDYSYMRVLKYFIWKDEIKTDSDGNKYVSETSDLANWIENFDAEEESNNSWTIELR